MPKMLRPRYWCSALAVGLALSAFAPSVQAATQATPMGLADIMAGVLPPPGQYWLNYLVYVHKNALMDDSGDKMKAVVPVAFDTNGAPLGFAKSKSKLDVDVFVEAARFVWITPAKILGANYGMQVIFPFYNADMDLKFKVPGSNVPNGEGTTFVPAHNLQAVNENAKGLGDIVVAPLILAWHFSPNFHMGAAVDIILPTANWDSSHPATTLTNTNVVTFEPLVAVSYWQPGGIDLSAKIMYDFNGQNSETKTRPGQEFHFDWGASWGFSGGAAPDEFRAGLAGFCYWQVTPDVVRGDEAKSKTESRQFAIGPAFKWWPKMGPLSLEAKGLYEFGTKNAAQGYSVWIDSIFAF